MSICQPAPAGDTPVQSLNACMALQWLQAYADGVLLFRNDSLLQRLQQRAGGALGAGDTMTTSLCPPPLPQSAV